MSPSGLIGDFTALTRNQFTSTYLSENMKSKLDDEIQKILQKCLTEVEEIIDKNWLVMDSGSIQRIINNFQGIVIEHEQFKRSNGRFEDDPSLVPVSSN